MSKVHKDEIIIVRSLTDSDLGIFAIHRSRIFSKQRAVNINAIAAKQLLSTKIFKRKVTQLQCKLMFENVVIESVRHLGKVGKNWRLGGSKIEGECFAKIDSRDFLLLRSIEHNDGTHPVTITIIPKTSERSKHTKIAKLAEPTLKHSMQTYREKSAGFDELAQMFPK